MQTVVDLRKQKVFVILPIYNEGASLKQLLEKIREVFLEMKKDFTVIAVNDASTDNSLEIIQNFSKLAPMRIIQHKINRGLGETSRDGFELAAELADPNDVIIRLDADDTHDPAYIPVLLKKTEEGFEVVIASRFQPGGGASGVNSYRTFISLCANLFLKIIFPIKGVREYSCGYRAYRAQLIQDCIKVFGNRFIDLKGLGFTCTVEKLIKCRMFNAKMAEIPFRLKYDQKLSDSKMVTSITTLGYFVLILKYIHRWGPKTKAWFREIKNINRIRGR